MTSAVRRVDNWKFWVGVAYFGLACTVVWLFFLNQKAAHTQANQARDEAVRVSELEAAATAQREQCLASIPTLRRINRFVAGVYELHAVLEANSLAIVNSTPKSDPARAVRVKNWRRIKATVNKVEGVRFPVPTRGRCEAIGHPPSG